MTGPALEIHHRGVAIDHRHLLGICDSPIVDDQSATAHPLQHRAAGQRPGIAGGGDWSGPPRLVTLRPDTLLLNGQPVAADALPGALSDLMQSTADAVLLRPEAGTDVQTLLDLMAQLRAAGLTGLSVVE